MTEYILCTHKEEADLWALLYNYVPPSPPVKVNVKTNTTVGVILLSAAVTIIWQQKYSVNPHDKHSAHSSTCLEYILF